MLLFSYRTRIDLDTWRRHPSTGNDNMTSSGQSEEVSPRSEEANLISKIDADPSLFSDRPIVCVLEEDPNQGSESGQKQRCRMFKIIRSKGKALASGGFGVTIAQGDQNTTYDAMPGEEPENNSKDEPETSSQVEEVVNKQEDNSKTIPTISSECLFIEEVLFLHEKGLLHAFLPSNTLETASPLDTSQLYQLLPSLGISLAIYRVYSHLRSQDFRVLRHDPNRYEILLRQKEDAEERMRRKLLKQQQSTQEKQETIANKETLSGETKETENIPADSQTGNNPRAHSVRLRHRIRESIQHASPPIIPKTNGICCNTDTSTSKIGICWDAYNPNSNFGKTHPGFPDFYVTVTFYNVPMVAFSDVNTLLKNKCNGIPLKVATVSDSGTVLMFGVTDYGIPSLNHNVENTS